MGNWGARVIAGLAIFGVAQPSNAQQKEIYCETSHDLPGGGVDRVREKYFSSAEGWRRTPLEYSVVIPLMRADGPKVNTYDLSSATLGYGFKEGGDEGIGFELYSKPEDEDSDEDKPRERHHIEYSIHAMDGNRLLASWSSRDPARAKGLFTALIGAKHPGIAWFANGELEATFWYDPKYFSALPRMRAEVMKWAQDKDVNGSALSPDCKLIDNQKPCFFTTATVSCLGLSDDCWELSVLRSMRDRLREDSDGANLVMRYEREAPAIVGGINARSDAAKLWLHAYWTGILPSALFSALGCRRVAKAVYSRLFTRLSAAALSDGPSAHRSAAS